MPQQMCVLRRFVIDLLFNKRHPEGCFIDSFESAGGVSGDEFASYGEDSASQGYGKPDYSLIDSVPLLNLIKGFNKAIGCKRIENRVD